MNWKHTRLTLSLISGAVLLTACAGAEVRPIVDMKGVNETRYEKDLAECQDYAKASPWDGQYGCQGCGCRGQ
jgi:hypothetical protein